VELLLYLGRAFVKAQKLEDALKVLIRARHADPTQSLVLFNLSIVMQKLATQTLKDEKANLAAVLKAVAGLQLAKKQLLYASENGDKMKFDLRAARVEASHCDDLVNQAAYHIRRATEADQQLKCQQAEQEKERLALKMKQEKEEEEKKMKREQEAQELLLKRQTFLEKTKGLLAIGTVPTDEPAKKPKSKKPKNYDIYSSGDEAGGGSGGAPRKPRKSGVGSRGGAGRERERGDRKSAGEAQYRHNAKMTKEELEDLNDFIDDGEFFTAKDYEKVKKQRLLKNMSEEYMSAKQKAKIKSKAYISSSDDDSSGDEGGKSKKGGPSATATSSKSASPTRDASEAGDGGSSKKRKRLDSDSSAGSDQSGNEAAPDEASTSAAKTKRIESDSD